MADFIKDGTGQGYLARVNPSNRLTVSSQQNSRIYYVSRDGKKAFSTNWALTQVLGGATEGLGYLIYTGEGHLITTQILLCTEEPATGLTSFGLWVNSATLTGGVARAPTNMNLTSSLTSDVTNIHNDDSTVVTITGGFPIYTVRLSGSGSYQVDLGDSLILGKNNSIAIKTSAATTGTKIRATLLYFEE